MHTKAEAPFGDVVEGLSRILSGDSLMKISKAAEREEVTDKTIWEWIKSDPSFPKPVSDKNGRVRLIVREYEAYLAMKYSHPQGNRAQRARGSEKFAAHLNRKRGGTEKLAA